MRKIDNWNMGDTEDILYIERMTQSNPLTRKDFLSLVNDSDIMCLVMRENGLVLGFVLYGIYKFHLNIYTMVVHPDFRKQGIGTSLLEEVKNRVLKHPLRRVVFLKVRESHLETLYWAKKRGFLAISIDNEAFSVPDEDGIIMKWATPEKAKQEKGVLEDITL